MVDRYGGASSRDWLYFVLGYLKCLREKGTLYNWHGGALSRDRVYFVSIEEVPETKIT